MEKTWWQRRCCYAAKGVAIALDGQRLVASNFGRRMALMMMVSWRFVYSMLEDELAQGGHEQVDAKAEFRSPVVDDEYVEMVVG